jgi:hypothetical protein
MFTARAEACMALVNDFLISAVFDLIPGIGCPRGAAD